MSDDELRQRAETCIPKVYTPSWRGVIYLIGEPPGAWVEPEPLHGRQYLDGPLPFFVSREDGSIVRFPRRERYRAEAVLHQWIAAGVVGVHAHACGHGPALPSAFHEALARAWLVGVPRFATLHVPTADELPAAMPQLATWDGVALLIQSDPRRS